MDTSSLIVALCVTIPALIAVSVCGIIFYSRRSRNQTVRQRLSPSYGYHRSYERRPPDDHVAHFSPGYHSRQPHRLQNSPPVFEQSPPPYNTYPTIQTRRQPLPLFSPVRTTPVITNVRRTSFASTPSIYTAMPPSYAELFLTPQTLTNR